MNGRIKRRIKYLNFTGLFFLINLIGFAQTDILTLSRAKDFINAELTYIVISKDSLRTDSIENKGEIEIAFQNNTLRTPLYFRAMQQLLNGKFDSIIKKFSAPVDQIDVRAFANLNLQKAMQVLYDSAFAILHKSYPFILPDALRYSVYASMLEKTEPIQIFPDSTYTNIEKQNIPIKDPVANYEPWYLRFKGFLFWLLACVLISVILFLYCLDQIRQLKIKLNETEKLIDQVRDEKDSLTPNSGPVTTVYTEFRSLVTLKIKELYDIIDHLNLRIIAIEKKELNADPFIEEAMKLDDSIDNEGIFYMSAPLDGHFPFSARSLKKDALYKFTLNHSETEAHFEVINEGFPISEALQNIPVFIEPACIAENEPQGEVRVIITKNPGIAFFDRQQWTIQQKAVILFI